VYKIKWKEFFKMYYDDEKNKGGVYEAPPFEPNDYGNSNGGHTGFAIASLVLGILSLILCCCFGLNFVIAIPALILGTIALAKRYSGKGMAIAGIIISGIAILITSMMLAFYGPIFSDVYKAMSDFENIRDTYEATGEIPEYLEKYTDEKYDEVWKSKGYNDFYEFFDALIDEINEEYTETN